MKGIDAEIDRLYQLPLDEFTGERNALAKRAGADAPRIRELSKPSVPAWAVNQLYWHNRDEWNALVAASENLRRTHKAVLAGRHGDVRAAGKVHDEAIESAMKVTSEIVSKSSHPLSDATRQGIANTVRAIPTGDGRPGRLAKTLQPGGFEMLAGLAIAQPGRASTGHRPKSTGPHRPARESHSKRESHSTADAHAVAAARQEVASSERALRDAEQAVRREEFESARAAREEQRAAGAVEKARVAVQEMKADLERAEATLGEARETREQSERGIPKARTAVTAAEKRVQAAAAVLKKLTRA